VVDDVPLRDRDAGADRLHDHLAGELHPRGHAAQPAVGVARDRAQPAVGVPDPAVAEHQPQEAREQRVADVAVQRRHRPGQDVPHAVADHELRLAGEDRPHQVAELREVVGQVAVPITMTRCRAFAKPLRSAEP